jgi:hypothetical protein
MRASEIITETKRKSAAIKLQGAWNREQAKSTASRQRANQAKAEFDKQWKEKKEKEQGVAEAGNKPLEKSRFGTGDTRTPRDIKSQMSGASDEFVRSTADKTTGPFHSKVSKMQGKMAKSELRKRQQGVAEGGEKYKIKSVGAEGGKDYYISPSTGKKVYKKAKVGDHENPNNGEHKPKVEGRLSRAIMKEFGLK